MNLVDLLVKHKFNIAKTLEEAGITLNDLLDIMDSDENRAAINLSFDKCGFLVKAALYNDIIENGDVATAKFLIKNEQKTDVIANAFIEIPREGLQGELYQE